MNASSDRRVIPSCCCCSLILQLKAAMLATELCAPDHGKVCQHLGPGAGCIPRTRSPRWLCSLCKEEACACAQQLPPAHNRCSERRFGATAIAAAAVDANASEMRQTGNAGSNRPTALPPKVCHGQCHLRPIEATAKGLEFIPKNDRLECGPCKSARTYARLQDARCGHQRPA